VPEAPVELPVEEAPPVDALPVAPPEDEAPPPVLLADVPPPDAPAVEAPPDDDAPLEPPLTPAALDPLPAVPVVPVVVAVPPEEPPAVVVAVSPALVPPPVAPALWPHAANASVPAATAILASESCPMPPILPQGDQPRTGQEALAPVAGLAVPDVGRPCVGGEVVRQTAVASIRYCTGSRSIAERAERVTRAEA